MYRKLIIATLASLLVLQACNKSDNDNVPPVVENQILLDNNNITTEIDNIADIQNDAMKLMEGSLTGGRIATDTSGAYDCATITIYRNENPRRIVLDFGPVGCVGRDGRTRRGKIIWTYTNRITQPGAVVNTSFENFAFKRPSDREFTSIDNNSTKQLENLGSTGSIISFKRTGDVKMIFPDGTFVTWKGTRFIDWNHNNTFGWRLGWQGFDDTWTVKKDISAWSGVDRYGRPYTAAVKEDLIIKGECFQQRIYKPVAGILRYENIAGFREINYGNGTCNRQVTININNRVYTTRWF